MSNHQETKALLFAATAESLKREHTQITTALEVYSQNFSDSNSPSKWLE